MRRPGRFSACLMGFALLACRQPPRPLQTPPASLSVAEALRGGGMDEGMDERGYAKALAPRDFRFPADHGPHPELRTEWWYYTGNLAAADGRRFGFQLTFFRSALAPEMSPRASAWATRQAYLAHFAVTDAAGKRFRSAERWARGALGLAGAQAEPFRVWTGDWSAQAVETASDRGAPTPPMRLRAATSEVSEASGTDDAAIDLVLAPGKPPVSEGDHGLSRKSATPGNASYYYSLTRMPTTGTIELGGERFAVTGASWMDREWSTSSLARGQVGWDWFALQLDDGRDVMLYQLRRQDGSVDPASGGSVTGPRGEVRPLGREDFSIDVRDRWRSPRSGVLYPARWHLHIPPEGLDLDVVPLLAGQELDLSLRYWEGAVEVTGAGGLHGRGYVELTGYLPLSRR